MSIFPALIGLFIMGFLTVLIFLFFNTSETYVTLASTWAVVLGLTLLMKIPVRLLREVSPAHHKIIWEIEKNPPDWLPKKVYHEKNRITWTDRARFWYLILSYGTKSAHKIVGPKFLPQLFARVFRIVFLRIKDIAIDFERSGQFLTRNPIVSFLHFAGSLSAGTLNWTFKSVYRNKFVEATEDAAQKFGHHEALLLKTFVPDI